MTRSALWQLDELVAVAGGRIDGAARSAVTGFSIDTRSLAEGEVFVALTDARDGHEFVPAAFARGAAAAIVRRDHPRQDGDGPLIRVDDPLSALERIAVAARARLAADARVVAVTGSAGKTGTKEMLGACLGRVGETHAAVKSFNNHWGVPLTLARMPATARFGVFEIGMNHAGEITPLVAMVRPHVAIVTLIAPVHIAHFPTGLAGIADAKAEIFSGLAPGGVAVMPAEGVMHERLAAAAVAVGARILTFGSASGARVRGLRIEAGEAISLVEAEVGGRRVAYRVSAPGAHIAQNSLAVVAALSALGLPLEPALKALETIRAPEGRGARSELAVGGGRLLLIDESYNANPASVRAALAAIAGVPRQRFGRRIAVLGDMLELGPEGGAQHAGLRDSIDSAGVDLVFAAGPLMRGLYDGLEPTRQGGWAATSAGILAPLLAALKAGDTVMVKGSLGSRMGPVVDAIRAKFAG
jgi:UDP-N-acetylmuramoyl-tripeptide--D-alanyl-D-alanine ligase